MSEKAGLVEELHKAVRKNFPRRYVTIKGLDDLYQADLVEMIPYADENGGYKYLMTVIDTFSKRAWVEPLKTKTGQELAGAVDRLFSSLRKPPKFLQTDHGSEFYNKSVRLILNKYKIHLYSSFSTLKSSIIERFNRTLKSWMWKQFSLQGSYQWVDLLEGLLKRYNNHFHRTIGVAPSKVNYKNEKMILRRLMQKNLPKKKKNKFKVGDYVRISKYKHIFEKAYTPNWTTEVFVVDKVQKTVPVTYKLRDMTDGDLIQGGFYEPELSKTKFKDTYLVEKVIKKKGNKVFVKWLGFDETHNQWIDASDFVK